VNAMIIVGVVVTAIGLPVILLRAVTSRRGQKFLCWCMHLDELDDGEVDP
jgi:hypothetical protein